MTSSHWIDASFDDVFAGAPNLTPLFLNVPAGATIKKLLVRGIAVRGWATGYAFDHVEPVSLQQVIRFETGPYATRILYRSVRRLTASYVALYDFSTLQRVYTQYVCGTDNDCEINQQVSYGLASGGASQVSYRSGILAAGTGPHNLNFRAQSQFSILYTTTP